MYSILALSARLNSDRHPVESSGSLYSWNSGREEGVHARIAVISELIACPDVGSARWSRATRQFFRA
ncbi:hypothetical protein BDY21DRAFT_359348 [Lineolata rhizophorae]|uniref:Uncharacterized protein n=1 Tax=Lineolata rhizophorae TaxID=578093 RepID=A0A6A6NKZ8_9PEZI|nr:hypothetical protein BDY21DRAFT_359348 [Lineolata rhizophorae]